MAERAGENTRGFDKFAGSEFARPKGARRARRRDAPSNPVASSKTLDSHIHALMSGINLSSLRKQGSSVVSHWIPAKNMPERRCLNEYINLSPNDFET